MASNESVAAELKELVDAAQWMRDEADFAATEEHARGMRRCANRLEPLIARLEAPVVSDRMQGADEILAKLSQPKGCGFPLRDVASKKATP